MENPFDRVRNVQFVASPYLKTRVMAQFEERSRHSRRMRLWGVLSGACVAASVLLVALVGVRQPEAPLFKAQAREAVVVRVDVQSLKDRPIAFAEVSLPEGVHFQSEEHPEINSRQKLMLAWDHAVEESHLPVVIQSEEAGRKRIAVRYFDKDHRLIADHSVEIRFEARQSG